MYKDLVQGYPSYLSILFLFGYFYSCSNLSGDWRPRLGKGEASIKKTMERWRRDFWQANFPILADVDMTATNTKPLHPDGSTVHLDLNHGSTPMESHKKEENTESDTKYERVVLILCHSNDRSMALKLKIYIESHLAELRESFDVMLVTQSDQQNVSLEVFNQCHLMIPLLSKLFLQCPFLVEQLNSSVYRMRFQQRIISSTLIVGDDLPMFPAYPSLGLCFFNVHDDFWNTNEREEGIPSQRIVQKKLIRVVEKSKEKMKHKPTETDAIADPVNTSENANAKLIPETTQKLKSAEDVGDCDKRFDEAVHRCLDTAGRVFSNILRYSPTSSSSFKTLLSVVEVRKWSEANVEERKSMRPLCFHSDAEITASTVNHDDDNTNSSQHQQQLQLEEQHPALTNRDDRKEGIISVAPKDSQPQLESKIQPQLAESKILVEPKSHHEKPALADEKITVSQSAPKSVLDVGGGCHQLNDYGFSPCSDNNKGKTVKLSEEKNAVSKSNSCAI